LAALAVLLMVLLAAYRHAQWDGVLAALTALAACCFGIVSARIVGRLMRDPRDMAHRVWFGMLLRMGTPLIICMMAVIQGGRILELGFAHYLLILYPLTLAVDTLWSVGLVNQHISKAKVG
jgi:drug/metabolite transporter (DMT)-like permease